MEKEEGWEDELESLFTASSNTKRKTPDEDKEPPHDPSPTPSAPKKPRLFFHDFTSLEYRHNTPNTKPKVERIAPSTTRHHGVDNPSMDILEELPLELAVGILSLLTFPTLLVCRQVSRTWEGLASFDLLWEIELSKRYPLEHFLARSSQRVWEAFDSHRSTQKIWFLQGKVNMFLPTETKPYKDIFLDLKRFYLRQPSEGCLYTLAQTPCPICGCSLSIKTDARAAIHVSCPSKKSKWGGCGLQADLLECYECGMTERFTEEHLPLPHPLCSKCRGSCLICGRVDVLGSLFECTICGEYQKPNTRKIERDSTGTGNEVEEKKQNEKGNRALYCLDCSYTCATDWIRVCELCSFTCNLCAQRFCNNCREPGGSSDTTSSTTSDTCLDCHMKILPTTIQRRRRRQRRHGFELEQGKALESLLST